MAFTELVTFESNNKSHIQLFSQLRIKQMNNFFLTGTTNF